jgi:hypothetical protein
MPFTLHWQRRPRKPRRISAKSGHQSINMADFSTDNSGLRAFLTVNAFVGFITIVAIYVRNVSLSLRLTLALLLSLHVQHLLAKIFPQLNCAASVVTFTDKNCVPATHADSLSSRRTTISCARRCASFPARC